MERRAQLRKISEAEHLLVLAQQVAELTPDFFKTTGPGQGNIRANAFMKELKKRAKNALCEAHACEAKPCGNTDFAIDFYFPAEETAVEIAGMLGAPNSEYEKDIFKCLLAKSRGAKIKKLVLIGKQGSAKVSNQPGRRAIAQFVYEKFGIEVIIEELVDSTLT
jgi:hypothetical protein